EAGDEGGWTETPTALEDWPKCSDDPLVRAAVELPDDLREELTGYYLDRSTARGIDWIDRDEFRRRLELMSLQRNLKACGTFGYQAVVRGNDRYVRHLAPTFGYVKRIAPRHPFMRECLGVLARHIPLLQ
ncbi:MAG: hypothetical protein NT045_08830, partial [Candidatus Aureabacteria bacterium]|nr:hypothetical protein [Candidatus Auribacterota bacterium]